MILKGYFDVGYDADMSRKSEIRYLNKTIEVLNEEFIRIPLISDYGFVQMDDESVRFEFEVMV